MLWRACRAKASDDFGRSVRSRTASAPDRKTSASGSICNRWRRSARSCGRSGWNSCVSMPIGSDATGTSVPASSFAAAAPSSQSTIEQIERTEGSTDALTCWIRGRGLQRHVEVRCPRRSPPRAGASDAHVDECISSTHACGCEVRVRRSVATARARRLCRKESARVDSSGSTVAYVVRIER